MSPLTMVLWPYLLTTCQQLLARNRSVFVWIPIPSEQRMHRIMVKLDFTQWQCPIFLVWPRAVGFCQPLADVLLLLTMCLYVILEYVNGFTCILSFLSYLVLCVIICNIWCNAIHCYFIMLVYTYSKEWIFLKCVYGTISSYMYIDLHVYHCGILENILE